MLRSTVYLPMLSAARALVVASWPWTGRKSSSTPSRQETKAGDITGALV